MSMLNARRVFAVLLVPTLALASALAGSGRAAVGSPPAPSTHRIAIDARGPLALVEVTRVLVPERTESGGGEAVLDLALPDGAALSSVEVREAGRWRSLDPPAVGAPQPAADLYRAESAARGVTPAVEPFDDSATHRLRFLRGGLRGTAPVEVRYRFALVPAFDAGRLRLRFPAAPERLPPPADVTVRARGAADLDIAGVRTTFAGDAGTAIGRASMRAAWEVSWIPRAKAARETPTLDGRVAMAALSPTETALAFLVEDRAALPTGSPGNVLFLVDRSRSVGLPGLSAERDLCRKLIETLPPSTRFDALFFDRGTQRLFPLSRPATREAIDGFEAEMVPDRLQNGTDLAAALRRAGDLLRREQTTFGPRALVVLVTDGALPDDLDGAALDRALGPTPGLELKVAALAIRPVDDEAIGPHARKALRAFAAARGGVARELRANEIADAVSGALADLARGGDLGAIRLVADGTGRALSDSLPPDAILSGVVTLHGQPPRKVELEGIARGRRIAATAAATPISTAWLQPWLGKGSAPARILTTPSLVGLVEPILHPTAAAQQAEVKGSMDRMVVRNVLSLAYMPRARACYLNRTGATPALRALAGRVRLAIDVVRGEVDRATIESSTLDSPAIEACLRDSAFAIEVPRAARSDAPVTAILNMVFRSRTPDKKPAVDLGAVGAEIDLVIEEMHRQEASASASPTTAPASAPTDARLTR
jgi:von Willebrand factor type A domain